MWINVLKMNKKNRDLKSEVGICYALFKKYRDEAIRQDTACRIIVNHDPAYAFPTASPAATERLTIRLRNKISR